MSYSVCDFSNDCEQNADAYGLPVITRAEWVRLTGEKIRAADWPAYLDSEEGLRVLAERIARSMCRDWHTRNTPPAKKGKKK
jgi:hypothetical protein